MCYMTAHQVRDGSLLDRGYPQQSKTRPDQYDCAKVNRPAEPSFQLDSPTA